MDEFGGGCKRGEGIKLNGDYGICFPQSNEISDNSFQMFNVYIKMVF